MHIVFSLRAFRELWIWSVAGIFPLLWLLHCEAPPLHKRISWGHLVITSVCVDYRDYGGKQSSMLPAAGEKEDRNPYNEGFQGRSPKINWTLEITLEREIVNNIESKTEPRLSYLIFHLYTVSISRYCILVYAVIFELLALGYIKINFVYHLSF